MTIKDGNLTDAGETIEGYGAPLSQSSFEQVKVVGASFSNLDYLGADVFTDDNGAKDTVDTTASTAIRGTNTSFFTIGFTDEASGDSTNDPDSVSNPSNFFDTDDATFAEKTNNNNTELGKTFSSKFIGQIKIKARFDGDGSTVGNPGVVLETFNGSVWTAVATLETARGVNFDNEYFLNTTTQGIRIAISTTGGVLATHSHKFFTLEYGNFDASSTVETNTIINELVPKSIIVYPRVTLPTNTSITIDVSDDGGSTFAITGQSANTYIDTTSFSTGDLALRFNLASTDTSATPQLEGYGVTITDV